MTRRALIEEREIDRLVDLAADAGVSLRIRTDLDGDGETRFEAGPLGTFGEVLHLERALNDLARSAA